MNRSERIGIITGLVAISLLARYNSAIAETLKSKDKKINQTEQTTNIQQQASDDLQMNLMSPPDTIKEIKDRFYKIIVANPQEKLDADNIWNNAMKSPIWNFIKEEIIFIDKNSENDYERFVIITLLLDPEHKYGLSQQAFDIAQKEPTIKGRFDLVMDNIRLDIIIQEQKTTLQEQRELLKFLKEFENALKSIQKTFEQTQKK